MPYRTMQTVRLRAVRDFWMKALFVALLLAASTLSAQSTYQRCRAIDGDTLRCGGERIRLIGIYAPERSEAGGNEARQRLQAFIDTGRVHIEAAGHDRYGRIRAHVYVDGRRLVQADISAPGGGGTGGAEAISGRP